MSTQPNDGGPAFPVPNSSYPNGEAQWGEYGMSLRDWFAGQALSNRNIDEHQQPDWANRVAKQAYQIADAMIAARKTNNTAQ